MANTKEVRIDIGPMDWKLLRRQKRLIVGLTTGQVVTTAQSEAIEGVLNLIDAIQDRAVDDGEATESEVFGRGQTIAR